MYYYGKWVYFWLRKVQSNFKHKSKLIKEKGKGTAQIQPKWRNCLIKK